MLKGKTAIITGGSRGIGKAIALEMAKNGANIALIYNGNVDAATSVCEEISKLNVKSISYACNVGDYDKTEETIKQILNDFGEVDILVNNAGITKDKLLMQMDKDSFMDVINVNLTGAFNMIKHLSRHFIKKRSGKIINISSVVGLMGNAGQANYSSSKAGLIGLTKSVARELASRNINCNCIAPGFIGTEMTDKLSDTAKNELLNNIPLKKIGNCEDVANLALFLASDLSNYITGEIIKIDGGLYI